MIVNLKKTYFTLTPGLWSTNGVKMESNAIFKNPQTPLFIAFQGLLLIQTFHCREEQNISDARAVCKQHYETVDTVADAARRGHTEL